MGGLVELLGINGGTKTESNTLAEEDVVGKSNNTTVVKLDLKRRKHKHISILKHAHQPSQLYFSLLKMVSRIDSVEISRKERPKPQNSGVGITNLGEGDGVNAVLSGELDTDVAAGLGVPDGLAATLNLAVDLLVEGGAEDAEVISGSDGEVVRGAGVADSGSVGGDGGLGHVIAGRRTSKEALVTNNGIDVGSGTLEEVEEGTAVEVVLLEVEVELGTLGLGGGEEGEETLSLEALGEGVLDLDLGLESVGGVPGLGEGEA